MMEKCKAAERPQGKTSRLFALEVPSPKKHTMRRLGETAKTSELTCLRSARTLTSVARGERTVTLRRGKHLSQPTDLETEEKRKKTTRERLARSHERLHFDVADPPRL